MYLRKRKYQSKRTGKRRSVSAWTIRFQDHLGVRRELPAFTNRRATDELARRVEQLVQLCAAGSGPDLESSKWLQAAPQRITRSLVRWGLLEPERLAAGTLLTRHVDDWKAALLAKGVTRDHADLVTSRARKVLDGCGFRFHTDISATRVQRQLAELRSKDDISAQTFNFYLQAVKQFCRWMVNDRRATGSPLAHLTGLNVRTDRRHDRRALSAEEAQRLLETTEGLPKRFGMTGPERALLYRLALETGLRANEIRSLTPMSFEVDDGSPTVMVEAAYSKHRRADVLPLKPGTAALLARHLACKMPTAPVFKMPVHTSRMIRSDLQAADIPYCDASGRYADFHALRHTFITNLARSGAHPSAAQTLARHSTITLTMDRYTHTIPEQLTAALEKLPDLSARRSGREDTA